MSETTPDRSRRRSATRALGIGCASLVALALLLIIALVVFSQVQLRRVQAQADAVHPGMTGADAVSRVQKWWYIRLIRRGDEENVYMAEYDGRPVLRNTHTGERTYFSSQADFLEALRKLVSDGHGWTMHFRYITVMPRQASFEIELDEQGRVVKVGEVNAED